MKTNQTMLAVKKFCTVNEVSLEELINTSKKGGVLAELRKSLTKKLIDSGFSFPQVADIFQSRVQLAKYYYYSPELKSKEMELLKLERKMVIYEAKVSELTESLHDNTKSSDFMTVISDRNHYLSKRADTKQKIANLTANNPKLGFADPETKWNGYKNGNPIY